MLSVYDLKLTSTCEDPQMTHNQFLQHLKDCFHMNPALMPSHTIWLDFSNKNVSDRMCSEEVILLCKTLYFEKWFKLFVCSQFQQIKIIMLMYSCLALQNAASFSVEFIVFNELHKNSEMTYNKAYNSQKKLFITILKGHILFDNPAFKALGFSQSQLDQWYMINQHNLTAFIKNNKDSSSSTSHFYSHIAQKYI